MLWSADQMMALALLASPAARTARAKIAGARVSSGRRTAVRVVAVMMVPFCGCKFGQGFTTRRPWRWGQDAAWGRDLAPLRDETLLGLDWIVYSVVGG